MKRLSAFTRTTASLFALVLLIAAPFFMPGSTAYAIIACPLTNDQAATYSCNCNPGLYEVEPADPVRGCAPCPYAGGAQPQSAACACPTYCRSDSGNPVTPDPTAAPVPVPPLSATQLAACQKALPKINATVNRLLARGQQQLQLFSTIADQAERFYGNSGKTLAAYDTLAAAVNSDKQVAQSQLSTLQTTASAGLDCSQSDPQSSAANLVAAARSEVAALQAYRTATKDLLSGIQSAAGSR